MKKTNPPSKRIPNVAAKALREGQNQPKRIESAKAYRRKPKHPGKET